MKIIIDKCSVPGWSKKFDSLEEAKNCLQQHICSSCLQTQSDIENNKEAYLEGGEDYFEYNLNSAIPDDFNELPCYQQINILLDSICGLEYDMNIIDEELNKETIELLENEKLKETFSSLFDLKMFLWSELKGEQKKTKEEDEILSIIDPETLDGFNYNDEVPYPFFSELKPYPTNEDYNLIMCMLQGFDDYTILIKSR